MPVKNVLVVDDSPTERHALSEILRRAGYEVNTCDSGEEAVAQSKVLLPDLILMDVVMPGLNGFQATRVIARDDATKHIPVIMVNESGASIYSASEVARDSDDGSRSTARRTSSSA